MVLTLHTKPLKCALKHTHVRKQASVHKFLLLLSFFLYSQKQKYDFKIFFLVITHQVSTDVYYQTNIFILLLTALARVLYAKQS